MPLGEVLDTVGGANKAVEQHHGSPVRDCGRVNAGNLELGAIHKDCRHVSGFELLRRDEWFHHHEAARVHMPRHTLKGQPQLGGESAISDRREEAGHGVEASSEVKPPHIAFVER